MMKIHFRNEKPKFIARFTKKKIKNKKMKKMKNFEKRKINDQSLTPTPTPNSFQHPFDIFSPFDVRRENEKEINNLP